MIKFEFKLTFQRFFLVHSSSNYLQNFDLSYISHLADWNGVNKTSHLHKFIQEDGIVNFFLLLFQFSQIFKIS